MAHLWSHGDSPSGCHRVLIVHEILMACNSIFHRMLMGFHSEIKWEF